MWTQQCRGDRYEKVGGGSSEVKATHSHDLGAQMFTSDSGIDHIVHAVLHRAERAARVRQLWSIILRSGASGLV